MKKLRALALCLNLAGTAALPAWAESTADTAKTTDVVLIGGGVMSATLGTYLQKLQPDWSITMVERLDIRLPKKAPTAGITRAPATRPLWN